MDRWAIAYSASIRASIGCTLTNRSLLTLHHTFVTTRLCYVTPHLCYVTPRLCYELSLPLQWPPVWILSLSHRQASGLEHLEVQQHISRYSWWSPLASNQEKDPHQDRSYGIVGAAPEYLRELPSIQLSCQWTRSASPGALIVQRFRLQTFGHWAFCCFRPPNLELTSAQSSRLDNHVSIWKHIFYYNCMC